MPGTEPVLTSSRNPLLKDIRRAVSRGVLTEQGFAVAEGFHLLDEALRSGLEVGCVLAAASRRSEVQERIRKWPETRIVAADDGMFSELSSTESSQGVIALVRPPAWKLEQLFQGMSLVVMLDGIQDPGNAGAIVRAAEAFGATGGIFLHGTVSPHNPKTLRASAGSLFRVPIVHGLDRAAARAEVDRHKLRIYAATPRGTALVSEADFRDPFALIMGSESRGVNEQFRSGVVDLRIPTTAVESLNVAMAAGIILYESSRQRLLRA